MASNHTIQVRFTHTTLTLVGKSRIEIELDSVDAMASEDQALIYYITGEGTIGEDYSVSLSHADCLRLAAIAKGQSCPTVPAVVVSAPAVVVSAPAVVVSAPAVVAPVVKAVQNKPVVVQPPVKAQVQAIAKRDMEDAFHACIQTIRGHGKTPSEREIRRLQRAKEKFREFWMLNYDIPAYLTEAKLVSSPCKDLRAIGAFMASESQAMIPVDSLQHPLFIAMLELWAQFPFEPGQKPEEKGITVRLVRMHPDEVGYLVRMCSDQIDAKLRDLHTSLIERMGEADKRLAKIEKELEDAEGTAKTDKQRKALRKRHNDVRAIIRSCYFEMQEIAKQAELYDCTEDCTDLFRTVDAAIKLEIKSFNARAEKDKVKPVNLVPPVKRGGTEDDEDE